MRLWTLHPKYLDAPGLVALWREALLAQAVLRGRTKGYTRHPQLARFSAAPSPVGAIAAYLRVVLAEASRRGYRFDAAKIGRGGASGRIAVPGGQLDYEWAHLKTKMAVRSPGWLERWRSTARLQAHPLFRVVPGGVAPWEVVRAGRRS